MIIHVYNCIFLVNEALYIRFYVILLVVRKIQLSRQCLTLITAPLMIQDWGLKILDMHFFMILVEDKLRTYDLVYSIPFVLVYHLKNKQEVFLCKEHVTHVLSGYTMDTNIECLIID